MCVVAILSIRLTRPLHRWLVRIPSAPYLTCIHSKSLLTMAMLHLLSRTGTGPKMPSTDLSIRATRLLPSAPRSDVRGSHRDRWRVL